MKKILFLILTVGIVAFVSCRKVIDLEVSDMEQRIVIEGEYNAFLEEVNVNISRTKSVFSPDTFEVITDADVEIIGPDGISSLLQNHGDGNYSLKNYVPQFDKIYRMRVTTSDEVYEAEDSLVSVVPFDSIAAEYQPPSPIFGEGFAVFMYITDPQGKNFYRIDRKDTVNNRFKWRFQLLFDDDFTEGNQMKVPLITRLFEPEDTLDIRIISYSEEAYNYYNEMLGTVGGYESSPAPANPRQMWTNDALGNFSAFGYDSVRYILPQN